MSNAITPTLQASVICEDVRQEVNNMQSLIGILTVIPAEAVPAGVLKLCIWTRWSNGDGKYKQTARIVAPDGKTTVAEAAVEFELKGASSHATNVHFFAGLQFKEFGLYHVEVSLDGKLATRYPLALVQVKRGNAAPAGSPANN